MLGSLLGFCIRKFHRIALIYTQHEIPNKFLENFSSLYEGEAIIMY